MTTVAIVYHSGYGHTAVVADHVAQGVTEGGATPVLLRISGADQDFTPILDAIGAADAVIFGSPTYMGGVSGPFKVFADATSRLGLPADEIRPLVTRFIAEVSAG